jgi:hypothetical protein
MRRRVLVFLLAPLLAAPSYTTAQEPSQATEVVAQLATMNATLGELLRLIRQGAERQDIDLLMKRVELSSGLVAEAGRRLREVESELSDLENESGNVETKLAMLRLQKDSASSPETVQQFEIMESQSQSQMKKLRERMALLRSEVVGLKADLEANRDELRDWKVTLDKRLTRFGG